MRVEPIMIKSVVTLTLISASMQALVAIQPSNATAAPANPVVQWNRNLLAIVRTPGAQPGTIHPTRSFAMMHAAIYDAVNAIDGTHLPYRIQIRGRHRAPPKKQRQQLQLTMCSSGYIQAFKRL